MSKFEISDKESQFLNLLEQIVTDGVARGIKKGIEQAKNEERLREKITYDTRIKNTRLLLKNYRSFVKACKQATFTEKELETATVEEVLDKLFCQSYDEVTVVQSILTSKKRTEIILTHIERIINFYIFESEQSKNDEKIRKAHILNDLYVEGKYKPKINAMSEKYHISERQIRRDANSAIEEIAVLMFGIDGIRKM
ncbi:MAG: hypothetical protein UIT70_06965 [Clostridia bacterium]|nr:hypothetical protein [Clostridia bacterium]DAW44094.1 MAG TPA: hypothetical protein [Caudoviricetes sp.]